MQGTVTEVALVSKPFEPLKPLCDFSPTVNPGVSPERNSPPASARAGENENADARGNLQQI